MYRNKSEPNKVVKEIDFVVGLNGELKESTSIINPTIKIAYDGVVDFNYCYIPEFQRYYFITDIVSARRGIWSLEMRVDVLMSFKEEIRQLTAVIERNEFEYNSYLPDECVPSRCNPVYVYTEVENDAFTDIYTRNEEGDGYTPILLGVFR